MSANLPNPAGGDAGNGLVGPNPSRLSGAEADTAGAKARAASWRRKHQVDVPWQLHRESKCLRIRF